MSFHLHLVQYYKKKQKKTEKNSIEAEISLVSRILFTQKDASSFIYAINPLAWTGRPQAPAYAILQPTRFTKADESLRHW